MEYSMGWKVRYVRLDITKLSQGPCQHDKRAETVYSSRSWQEAAGHVMGARIDLRSCPCPKDSTCLEEVLVERVLAAARTRRHSEGPGHGQQAADSRGQCVTVS